jgi:hypothetical protein
MANLKLQAKSGNARSSQMTLSEYRSATKLSLPLMFQCVVIFSSEFCVGSLNFRRNPIVTFEPAIKIDPPATLTTEREIRGINPAFPFVG